MKRGHAPPHAEGQDHHPREANEDEQGVGSEVAHAEDAVAGGEGQGGERRAHHSGGEGGVLLSREGVVLDQVARQPLVGGRVAPEDVLTAEQDENDSQDQAGEQGPGEVAPNALGWSGAHRARINRLFVMKGCSSKSRSRSATKVSPRSAAHGSRDS